MATSRGVLAQVPASFQQVTPILPSFHTREMAGGDLVRTQLPRPADERAEFQPLIAHHARVGCAAGLVFLGEVIDDLLLEIRRLIHQVVRDVELVGHRPRIGNGLGSAALVLGARYAILRPELESDADHVIALLKQQGLLQ